MIRLLLAVLAWAALHAAAAEPAAQPGRAIYNYRCSYCHGYSGDARTLAASFLTPKPRDFTATAPDALTREAMVRTVKEGKPGTAMKSFRRLLDDKEIDAVVDFVRTQFMTARAPNTRYHTRENGWADHDRYADAYPFARGELALSTPPAQLTPAQRRGRQLYVSACISCHDRGRAPDEIEAAWESRPLSYPLNGDTPTNVPRGVADPYRTHDQAPVLRSATVQERRGEKLFQANCSFCHAADGTGKNWIGAFMEPPARNLTGPDIAGIDLERLRFVIGEGLPGTSMPAWKHVLKPGEIDAIARYVLKAFRGSGRS
jgi:cytochrome c oxidase cbb3-type subunit 3